MWRKLVTITGVNDVIDDDDVDYTIVTGDATSADGAYHGLNVVDVSVTNTDNDTAAITVTPTSGLVTTEAGDAATFDVVLATQPTANVTISIASSDTTEGGIDVSSILFNPTNWNVPQTITITGVNDVVADGDVSFVIVTEAASSNDPLYQGLDGDNVAVTNQDNEFHMRFDFGTSVSPLETGYERITSSTNYDASNGYGWTEGAIQELVIASGTALTRDLNATADGTFVVDVPFQGSYEVTVTVGHRRMSPHDNMAIVLEGVQVGMLNTLVQPTLTRKYVTRVVDGQLAVRLQDLGGIDPDVVIQAISVELAAGVSVTPTLSPTTTEIGGATTFDVVLVSPPTDLVLIGVDSSNHDEGTADVSTLSFTPENWDTAQTVTVTGVDDAIDDGDVTYMIIIQEAVSDDPNYSGLNLDDVSVLNEDNDVAGIVVTPTSGLVTTELTGTDTFDVVLNSQPTDNVSIDLESSNLGEGTISTSTLLFTPVNWNVAQTITVTGVNDAIDDGDVGYTIITQTAVSDDPNYSGLNGDDVSVVNEDNDVAGIVVTPTSGLVTTELTGTDTFDVVLNSQPTDNVSIDLESSNLGEGTISSSTLLFTPANWNVAQTVTVTGVNDAIDDGDVGYTIITQAAVSDDPNYSGLNGDDVSVVNEDNDVAGIVVTPTSGLVTTELTGTDTFDVVLNSQPTDNVSIDLESSNLGEGTISTSTLLFTPANWNVAQTVTVTGVNDAIDDGDVGYTIITQAAVSDDPNYSGLNGDDVSVVNEDNDVAGIVVTPTSGLVTTELTGTDTFDVVLNSQPTDNVSIDLESSNLGEGTISTSTLLFTPANWNVAQTVTVTGVNDVSIDGDVAYTIITHAAVSDDPNYSGLNGDDVSVVNEDNDVAGVVVTPTSGLVTTESTGTDTFDVVLNSQPTDNVSIDLESSDLGEGTISTSTLLFTPANWNVAQTVTVTGVNDAIVDGDVGYTIITQAAVSDDPNYSGLNGDDVSVVNEDNDVAGIVVTPTSGLVTTESTGTDTFDVVLNSQPTDNVSIDLESSNLGEGTISTSTLLFTPANWNVAQTVTVTGVNDAIDDGDVGYTIITQAAVSDDPNYSGLNGDDISVVNEDNDVAGVVVTPTSGLVTTELTGTDTFDVVLNSQPTDNVSIDLESSNLGEGTISTSTLLFTPANWNVAQTVTVTGVNDAIDDGDVGYTIITHAAVSDDPNYSGLNGDDISVVNEDNDVAGIVVTPTSGLVTTELTGTDTFDVVLNSQPTDNVSIDLESSNLGEGTISSSTLLFTPANWNVAQTVTVTGVNDAIDDGDVGYTIITHAAVSDDPNYSGLNGDDVSVVNEDNDVAGIVVTPISGLVTTELTGADTFDVVLNSQPTDNVSIDLESSNLGEGTISTSTLLFTPANWNVAQTVTVTGVNDVSIDGDVAYTIITHAAVSDDPNYSGLNGDDVSVVNEDNDVAGVVVTPTSGLVTTELTGTDTFDVVLSSQPTDNVSIDLESSNLGEGTISTLTLLFTPANWNIVQTVTVTGVDEAIFDGDVAYTIITHAAVSDDPDYSGLNGDDVSVVNLDNDGAGIIVAPTSGLVTTEMTGADTFDVVLNSQPTDNVSIDLESSNLGEGTISTSTLLFTPANWNVAQTVTVTGVNDAIDDGDVGYTIITHAAVSDDPIYSGLNGDDVSVVNEDNDVAGIVVTPISGLVTTELTGTDTFDVVLNSQPTDNVSIDLESSNLGEGTLSTSTLLFTPANWNVAQTVTVTGVNDAIYDGDVGYTIITQAAVSDDPNYSGLNGDDVSVVNEDNDVADVVVTPTSGLVTTELTGTDTFDVVLNSQPTDNVSIDLESSNLGEGTLSTSTLLFTPANWNVAQTVTVTGVNDAIDDGDVGYTIITHAAVSDDPNYSGLNGDDVSVVNEDNDVAGVVVTPTSGLVTTELTGTDTFDVVLSSQPTDNVSIDLESSNLGEGTISTLTLLFTPANWNVAQTVTVTGVNDAIVDGDVAYTIITHAAVSDDPNYSGLNTDDVSVVNEDNDVAGVVVAPISGLVTTELGGADTFIVLLDSQPTDNVLINLESSNLGEGTISSSSLLFTPTNWNIAQTVIVTGVNDAIDDGDVGYTIITHAAVSDDLNYSGLNGNDVSVVNEDNDVADIIVTPTLGLVTTESGEAVTFEVVLNSQPTENVQIGVSSSDLAEGTVNLSSLLFTPANWNVAQTVTVTGVDDAIADGDTMYTIVTSAGISGDPVYDRLDASDVMVTNTNDDTAGVTVTPNGGLLTWAPGTGLDNVIIEHAGLQDPSSEGWTLFGSTTPPPAGVVDASSNEMQFEAWNLNSNAAGTAAPLYRTNGYDASQLNELDQGWKMSVVVRIVDGPEVPNGGLSARFDKDNAMYWMWFGKDAAGNTLVDLPTSSSGVHTITTPGFGGDYHLFELIDAPSDSDGAANGAADLYVDGILLETGFTGFTNTISVVRVIWGDISGAAGQDGEANWALVTLQGGASLHSIPEPTALGLSTTETGATASFDVVLDSQPTQDVTIDIVSNDTTEGTPDVSILTFTPANWNVAQTVTVTGVNDATVDGDVPYSIITTANSSDTVYDSIGVSDVNITNFDSGSVSSAPSAPEEAPSPTSTVAVQDSATGTPDSLIIQSASELEIGTDPISHLRPIRALSVSQRSLAHLSQGLTSDQGSAETSVKWTLDRFDNDKSYRWSRISSRFLLSNYEK